MDKKFIKMNDNKDYLSLGNLINIIKYNSKKKESSIQTQVFCSLFDINDINNTTVNNYLIGYRAIGLEYKKIYLNYKEEYKHNKMIFKKVLCNVLTILEEKIFVEDDTELDKINNNKSLNKVCENLISLSKNDISISKDLLDKVINLYNDNNLYECFIELLLYAVLENKQPIYNQDINIQFKNKELDEYLKINLYEGISYISSLIELSKKDNMYANAELGSLCYSGLINNNVDYESSYNYYKKAAEKKHPKACWMVANLILMDKVKEKSLSVMWEYLNLAIKMGSIAAINTKGKCYLNKKNIEGIIDEEKALECFNKASESGYSYAYNNLGLYYENKDIKKAFDYYKLSADELNSWALNKVGELLRKENKLEEAYFYYLKSIDTPIKERNYYGYYNLAKYYYLPGNKKLNIKSNKKLAKEYLKIALNNGINEALIELEKLKGPTF